ncbi:MAG: hypothetical protein IJ555_09075, partial [Ruminococcus sp.]|nr:hypothetical protein [Ruminococcus sp.]
AAYGVNEQIFVKTIGEYEFVKYPDYSCNFETYTNDAFLECEVIGEMRSYAPGEAAVISECWKLLDDPGDGEPDLDKVRAAIGK